VARDNGGFLLSVDLPFTAKDRISLSRHGDELVIDLGTWRRTLVLPRLLVDAPTEGARFENGSLNIRFGTPVRAEEKTR
jgi:arsenite-transporting ATPase